ncbi:hypothetical protein V8G54_035758 [Vigna mungo]|uniref:Uncharacterized protein n=1 Tax=Vigna mungo TaxID=3915 RepID=A0AAQ3MFW4_VIGMU
MNLQLQSKIEANLKISLTSPPLRAHKVWYFKLFPPGKREKLHKTQLVYLKKGAPLCLNWSGPTKKFVFLWISVKVEVEEITIRRGGRGAWGNYHTKSNPLRGIVNEMGKFVLFL